MWSGDIVFLTLIFVLLFMFHRILAYLNYDRTSYYFLQIYPLDATFDTKELVPEEVAKSKRYKSLSGYSIQEVVDAVQTDFGKIDFLVHSLANGPEVTKPLLETSRDGYLKASSASAYSLVSMVSRFGPILNEG